MVDMENNHITTIQEHSSVNNHFILAGNIQTPLSRTETPIYLEAKIHLGT